MSDKSEAEAFFQRSSEVRRAWDDTCIRWELLYERLRDEIEDDKHLRELCWEILALAEVKP